MGLIIIPVGLQILSRYTGIIPRYIWTEEVARFCFVWIVMIGSMVAVRDGTHFDVDLRRREGSERREAGQRLIVHLCMTFFALLFVRFGIEFAQFGMLQTSEMSEINLSAIYVAFPLAGATWCLFLFEHIVSDLDNLLNSHQEQDR